MKNKLMLWIIGLVMLSSIVYAVNSPYMATQVGSDQAVERLNFNYTGTSSTYYLYDVGIYYHCGASFGWNLSLYYANNASIVYSWAGTGMPSEPYRYVLNSSTSTILYKNQNYFMTFTGTTNCVTGSNLYPVNYSNGMNIWYATTPIWATNGAAPIPYFNFTEISAPAAPVDTLNMTDSVPATKTWINYTSATPTNFNLTVNSTVSFNCSLFFNSTLNQTKTGYSSGNNVFVSFNQTFAQKAAYTYNINCTNNDTSKLTSTKTFYVDSDLKLSATASPSGNYKTTTFNLYTNLTNTRNVYCDLKINNTLNETKFYYNQTNLTVNYSKTFNDGSYYYSINCSDGFNHVTTANQSIIIDTSSPTIITNLDNNNSYFSNVYSISLTATDNLKLYDIMINDSCGVANYYNSSISTPFIHLRSNNFTSCGFGTKYTNITLCDGNTSQLNCITKNYQWFANGILNITANSFIDGSAINSFTIKVNGTTYGSTTNGSYQIQNITSGTYNITFTGNNSQRLDHLINITSTYTQYTFTPYTINSINFTFVYENNKSVAVDTTIYVELIGTYNTYNYTTSTGYLYIDLIVPSDYNIRYSSNGKATRSYYFTLTNESHNDLTLYIIENSTTLYTATVYNELTLNIIQGAIVYLMRFDPLTNTYNTVSMYSTDPSGKAYFQAYNDEYYKFVVDYPLGTRRLETNPLYLQSTNTNLYISTTEQAGQPFYNAQSITYSLNYVSASNSFVGTWTDNALVSTQFCLYIKKFGIYSNQIINYSCSPASSGSISLTGMTENTTYFGVLTAKIGGSEKVIASTWKEFVADSLGSGQFGLFMTIVLVMIFSFLSIVNVLAPILATSALVLAKFIGILSVSWGLIIFLFIGSIIFAILVRLNK